MPRAAPSLLCLVLSGCHLLIGHSPPGETRPGETRPGDLARGELAPREGGLDSWDLVAPPADRSTRELPRFCSDGTLEGACSPRQPLHCNGSLQLLQDCTFCACPAGSLCGSKNRCQGTLVALAIADAQLAESQPEANLGSIKELRIGLSGMNLADQVLLDFDLSPIPPQANIDKATLELEVISWSGFLFQVKLVVISTPWSETQVSWKTAPGVAPLSITAQLGYGQNLVDVKPLITTWLGSPYVRYGLRIETATSIKTGIKIASREHATGGYHPRLTIDYR